MAELQKASVFAIKKETVVGTPVPVVAGADFIPLKSGFTMNAEVEQLENTEILNSLGSAKTYAGKENPTGSHPVYLKHSQVEGTTPEYALILESLMGGYKDCVEYDTVAGSTTSVINVGATEGLDNPVGKALLIKDGTNGYAIRNISSVSTDALSLNFNLEDAPAAGVNLGQAQFYFPTTSGHPSFTAWLYRANGGALEMMAGCKTGNASIALTAGQQAEMEFSYSGVSYYFNPIEIKANNKFIDVVDDVGVFAVQLTQKIYRSPMDLAVEIATKLTAGSLASGADTYTCTFSSVTGKFTIASDGTVLSLLWNTGTNAANSVGTTLGFSVLADDTAALTYTSDNAIVYSAPFLPTYNDADNVIVKGAELFIGSSTDNICLKASTVNVSIDNTIVDIDSLCAPSGLIERVPSSRSATITATVLLERHEVQTYDKLINNISSQAMVNIGAKDGAGNWVAGKCINIYLGNCSIVGRTLGGDDFVVVELTLNAFVDSNRNDIYLNFL